MKSKTLAKTIMVLSLLLAPVVAEAKKPAIGRWSVEKANKWYEQIGVLKGCNYLPRTATNTTEMWQKETFDPATIDQELGWAQNLGYNSVRIFVQYLVWQDDPDGLCDRLNKFLDIAKKHGIDTLGANGKYVIAPSQEIMNDVPTPNIIALIEAIKEYR